MNTLAESNVAEMVNRYLAAWNERNPGRRHALIADTWTDAGYYVDPHRRGDGHDGIDVMMQAVQERFPAYRFRLSGAVDRTQRPRPLRMGGERDGRCANALCRHGFRRRGEGRPFRVHHRLRRRGTWRAVEGVPDERCRRPKPRTTPAIPGGGVAGASLHAELVLSDAAVSLHLHVDQVWFIGKRIIG